MPTPPTDTPPDDPLGVPPAVGPDVHPDVQPDESPAAALRAAFDRPDITVLPGAYDALSARLAERAGFEAVFTTGFGLSASLLGVPDLGLMTMTENLERVRRLAANLTVPLVADLDTGYGNALNVRRAVGEAIDAGAGGVVLEDQAWPKRCGHMAEKRVVPTAEHARRIRAAVDCREERGTDLVVVGRTDAREPNGLDDAIERGHAYVDAGADAVFVEAPTTVAELERVAGSFAVPTVANVVEGGRTPTLRADELEAIGFDVVLYPVSALFAATRAVQTALETLRAEGSTAAVDAVSFADFEAVLGTAGYRERERAYADGTGP